MAHLPQPPSPGLGSTFTGIEVMNLTEDSNAERKKHESILLDLEAKKRAFSIDVPTLPQDVRSALRQLRLPVRLFGENLANVRDRLRMELARREVLKEGLPAEATAVTTDKQHLYQRAKPGEEEEEVTKYTRASQGLIQAREKITRFSMDRAKQRLEHERRRRTAATRKRARLESTVREVDNTEEPKDEAEISRMNETCLKLYKSAREMALEGSQYGDERALSAVCTSQVADTQLVATGSWSATIKLWDGSSPQLGLLGKKRMAHEDRIMGIAVRSGDGHNLAATASIDLTAKLWRIDSKEDTMAVNDNEESLPLTINELSHLRGHEARLCCCAFHPTGDYLATTSFDHSWRLWDVETGGTEILLQDGHAKETYGVGFHPDGSLVATTDYGGVVQNWDLRTGKSVCHFLGHAKRVLCAEYSPNGFQLATAGDDGTIKIWDMRRRKNIASIPAHSNLISQINFSHPAGSEGEFLVSSSFDGTAKLWSTRDWKMLATLRGHEGKVMGIGVLPNGVVTSGYDKTLKFWQ